MGFRKNIISLVVHYKHQRFDVLIDRTTKWGNPFVIGKDGTRKEVIEKYEEFILSRPDLLKQLNELDGKVLGCWCYPEACHGDVLVRLAQIRKILSYCE